MKRLVPFILGFFVLAGFLSASGAKEAKPLGSEENPIVWAFVPSSDTQKVVSGAKAMVDLLQKETGYFYKVLVPTEYGGAIEALASNPPSAHMASLNTFAYIIAAEKKVAKAELIAVRRGKTTYNGQIIARAGSGIKSLQDIKGKVFARVDPTSTTGWIIPSLMLRAAKIDLEKDVKILDAGSHDAVVSAVYRGDADAGACFVDARTNIQKTNPDVMEKVVVIATTIDVPNDGIQFSPAMPEDMRKKIVSAMLKIAKTEEGKKALRQAYNWDDLEALGDSFYDPFRQILQSAGVNPASFVK